MYSVVGLGKGGCNIAEKFSQYSQYEVYKIDSENIKEKNYFKLKKCDSIEEYETSIPSLKKFFKNMKGKVLFVIGGSGKIAGASLVILEQIKHCDINILYIKPEIKLLDDTKRKQERVVFYVLQEMARSALFERMYIIKNSELENILGQVPIKGYFDKLNELLVTTFHMINIFQNSESVTDTYSGKVLDVARISTLGLYDSDNNIEKWFYPIDSPREKIYYYAINEKKLESDGSLNKKITGQMKSLVTKQSKVSYGIYATEYEQDYAYCMAHSSKIQD